MTLKFSGYFNHNYHCINDYCYKLYWKVCLYHTKTTKTLIQARSALGFIEYPQTQGCEGKDEAAGKTPALHLTSTTSSPRGCTWLSGPRASHTALWASVYFRLQPSDSLITSGWASVSQPTRFLTLAFFFAPLTITWRCFSLFKIISHANLDVSLLFFFLLCVF